MQTGIFAKTFSGDLETIFDKIAAQGIELVHFNFECVGLPALPIEISPAVVDYIKQAADARNLQLPSISATFNMISPNSAEREEGLRSFAEIARIAPQLGTTTLSLCTGSRNERDKWAWHPDNATREAWLAMCSVMEKLLSVAEDYDLLLGVEPELGNVVSDPIKAKQLLDEFQTDRIKIILDPANLFEEGTREEIRPILAEAINLLQPHLGMAHAKDRNADGTFCAAGKGVVDFPFFIQTLKNAGFDGPIVLHGLKEEEVPECVGYLADYI